jgi:hypothetical protein
MRHLESENFALLALRRTLLQLAVVGVAAAIALRWIAPDSGTLALWCAMAPLSACAVNGRSLFAALLPTRFRWTLR